MDGYWVRQSGRQFWAGDLDAVLRMVADGRLAEDDEVFTGQKWERVRDHGPLNSRRKADPFEAWSDADGSAAESAYESYLGKGGAPRGLRTVPPPDPPTAEGPAVRAPVMRAPSPPARPAPPKGGDVPVPRPPAPVRDPAPVREPSRPSVAVAPAPGPELEDDEEATDPGARRPAPPPRGEIIDFPRATAPRPPPMPVPVVRPARREPPKPTPLVRPGRVLAYILVGAVGLGVWFTWIRWAGTSDAGVSTTPVVRTPAVITDTELDKVERELRALMEPDARPIKGTGALADALLVDLQHMRIDVATVDATVSEWTGRRADEPKAASLRVVIASAENLDRTIGGIALVVGRYARSYRITFEGVEVVLRTAEGERSRSLDAKRAEEFYMDRVSMERMLEP